MNARAPAPNPTQRIVRIRREYNSWVADETREDYALRFAPRSFRKWSPLRVAATAFGSVSFLALEAIGAAITLSFGFVNAVYAIICVGTIIFVTALPICYYSARNAIDMDLLARGASFGYIGSTITSLIYASFTFIFFALEAAIMAQALELYFHLPLSLGYLLSSIVVIPLVLYGITLINKLQWWTSIPWAVLAILPFVFIVGARPEFFHQWQQFIGYSASSREFDPLLFGMAATVSFSLIAQVGEQVDFLRFLPEKTAENKRQWWAALLIAGPGWIIPGMLKQLAGGFLAFIALQHQITPVNAAEPTHMYLVAWQYVLKNNEAALIVTAVFIVLSQVKINVTNAYAGSLAWSNFFSRLTHSHPGRIVWLCFNVLIAVLLMEIGLFNVIQPVLGLYSCVAIAWVGSLFADLVINKPLGLSPSGIEFRRAYLALINPVGVGSTFAATILSITAFTGLLGQYAQAFSAFIALGTAMIVSPLLAWMTRGRYYLARERAPKSALANTCCICDNAFESEDMALCPAYAGTICSLCCSLDARCRDVCKRSPDEDEMAPHSQWWSKHLSPSSYLRLKNFTVTLLIMGVAVSGILGMLLYQKSVMSSDTPLITTFIKMWLIQLPVIGTVSWWLVLNRESRSVAEEESIRQTQLLHAEIEQHRITDAALQSARAEADQANQAKSRFVANMSHELRTPLNSIIGYAQILHNDPSIPAHRRDAITTIRESSEHLMALVDETLDIARIEAGKFKLRPVETDFVAFITLIANMFRMAAARKHIGFVLDTPHPLPRFVHMDQQRVRQLLLNLIGNAVKFTQHGSVTVSITYRGQIARIQVVDSGPGISEADIERIFQPFQRANSAPSEEGTGLGLAICRRITEQMGGELTVSSRVGEGSTFSLRLFLPELRGTQRAEQRRSVTGYLGRRQRLLLVDDQPEQRALLRDMLSPLGFAIDEAESGQDCLQQFHRSSPDAVLIDLTMPGMSGLQTCRELRHQWPGPMIVITAHASTEFRDKAATAGCDGFITKPIRLPLLLDRLQQLLSLEWTHGASGPSISESDTAEEYPAIPPPQRLLAMRDHARIGYVKGITEELNTLEQTDSLFRSYTQRIRDMAKQFRTDEIIVFLEATLRHEYKLDDF